MTAFCLLNKQICHSVGELNILSLKCFGCDNREETGLLSGSSSTQHEQGSSIKLRQPPKHSLEPVLMESLFRFNYNNKVQGNKAAYTEQNVVSN